MIDLDIIELTQSFDVAGQQYVALAYEAVYQESLPESLMTHINHQQGLHCLIALYKQQPIAFKLGCINFNGRFFSWIGGVHSDYRRQGIAKCLLRKQIEFCKQRQYKTIHTEVAAENHAMLMLNLTHGYQICGSKQASNHDLIVMLQRPL